MIRFTEPAPAKLNLALHVRGKLADGRHRLETVFAFCTDGDMLTVEQADHTGCHLDKYGDFASQITGRNDLVRDAYFAMKKRTGVERGVVFTLEKELPVSAGLGGGSADAAAALRLLTRLWKIDPAHATAVAPELGSDVPACLLNMSARGGGAGDELTLLDDPTIAGTPVLLVNPRIPLPTGEVFARWDGKDRGPLDDWREGRNDLEAPAIGLVPEIGDVLDWLREQPGATIVRMSGSGATCFALFGREEARDIAAMAVPERWWHLATHLR